MKTPVLFLSCLCAAAATAPTNPNVIIILAADAGETNYLWAEKPELVGTCRQWQ